MKIKKLLYLISFLLLSFSVQAQQETIITGRVTEKGANSGIPFVNIYFKGTFIGTVTDFDGNYSIKTSSPKDSIFVSLIGYKSKAKLVKKGQAQKIDFQLSPEALNLTTVEVRPGVNPALRIIKNAQKNKAKYNRDNLRTIQYTSYTKQEADVDNVTAKMRRWRLFRGFTKLWDSLDVLAGEESKANLPVMMSEVISDIYYHKEGDKRHEDVDAVKIKFVGMKDGSAVSQLTGTDFQSYNFCNDNISLQGKDILCPIAENAMLFYSYYLIDSVTIDQMKCYKIDCRPKNKKDLAFTGTLWITDTTFAIKQLDVEITPEVNIDWVERARIQQIMIPTDTDSWVPEQTRTMVDYSTVTTKFVSLVVRTYNSNKDFIVNKPKNNKFYETRINYAENALTKDTAWWRTNRYEKLNPLEAKSYDMIDTVRSIPFIKKGVNILYFLFSGYKDVGPIDLGHYLQSYAYNLYEGSRINLGFRTNAKFSKDWIIRGYAGYGFRDKGFKYNLQVERILSRYPWRVVGGQYRNDIDFIGSNYSYVNNMNLGQSPNNIFNTFSHIGNISKLVKQQEYRVWYVNSFNNGITSTLTLQNIVSTPLFPVYYGDPFHIIEEQKYSRSEVVLDLRYAANERYVQNGNERINLGNKKALVVDLSFLQGIKNILGSDFNYSKVNVTISNRFKISGLGSSNVYVKFGKVFSQVPYTLLEIPRGNETYFFANNNFNIMNNFEFVADQYVEAYWQHHLNGLLFNRIPIIKELNWREVVGLNMAYGTLSSKNKDFNSQNTFTVMDDVPYFEADLGIENIFNVIRIDYLYRLTYNDDPYKQNYEIANPGNKITNWGIKIGFQISF